MIAYFLILAVIGLEYLVIKYKNNNNAIFVTFACVTLIVFSAARGEHVGADNAHYLSAYHILRDIHGIDVFTYKMPWSIDFEPGYLMLNRILAFFQLNDFMFQLIISSIIYIPVFLTIYRYSDHQFISILVYFAFGLYAHSLGLQRQLIAVSIVILGMKYISDRRFVRYAIYVVIASLFHVSAMFMIALFFLYKIKISKKSLVILIGIEFFMLFFSRNILNIVFRIFPSYKHYTDTEQFTSGGSYFRLMCLTAIVILAFFFYERLNITDAKKVTIDAAALSIIIQPVAYSFGLMGRVMDYTIVFLIVLVPMLVEIFEDSAKHLVTYLMIVLLLVMIYINLNGNIYVCPYYTMFKEYSIVAN